MYINGTDTLHLTINNPVHTATAETACESYTWNGNAYTTTGAYTYSHPDANGCTQVDTLHLTIYYSAEVTVIDTVENGFTWHDSTYTESGTYLWHGVTVEGCDSTVTLILVVNHVGVDMLSSNMAVTIYPNPTSGRLLIDANDVLIVEVYDLSGRTVAVYRQTNILDFSGLPKGSYTLKVHLSRGVSIKRVIVE